MLSLLTIAFLGGILTIAAPCILAVLPIILGSTIGHQNKLRPLVIVLGLTVSFTAFGILFNYFTNLFGIDSNTLRSFALIILGIFSLALIFPTIFEKILFSLKSFFSKFKKNTSATAQNNPQKQQSLWSAFLIGASLGLVWAPCAGPILAIILTLAITRQHLSEVILLMLSYSLGAGIPMLLIAYGGNLIVNKLKILKSNGERIQQIAGIILLIGVIIIAFGWDTQISTKLAGVFPSLNNLEEKLVNNIRGTNQQTSSISETSENSLNNVASLLSPPTISAPEFTDNQGWINSQPLKISDLKGKVVIVDFWTYSCINCLRTLPYLNSWYQKYSSKGLVIIGVHSPEFAFEKDLKNVQHAIKENNIQYPVVQDNNLSTWSAYNNQYWPAKYIIDKNGFIRATHFGEGNYDETEKIIQYLLTEGDQNTVQGTPISTQQLTNSNVDFSKIGSPETYLGFERAEYFGDSNYPESGGDFSNTKAPLIEDLNKFYLVGNWQVYGQNLLSKSSNSEIIMRYKANKANLVLDNSGTPIKAKVYLDGVLENSTNKGNDVDQNSEITINEAKLYNLSNTGNDYSEHTITIQFETSEVKAFAFTFG